MSKKINKGRLFRNVILVTLVLGCIGVYFSNRFVKTKGFNHLGDFITNYQTNKNLINKASPESLQLVLSDEDYRFLENKRQESLDRGIQVNKGDNYVKCKVLHNSDTLEGEIRLKGHMTDHLEGDKWSFRVKTKGEVMGMYRFSLQNPATRNYAYEWIYHELLKQEGIIHLKYDFIQLSLNDKDLGIYAIEEHFGQHILEDNKRPPGAILRWNPELYWEQRLDELDGVYLDEGYSNYESSYPEAYDRGVVKKDDALTETYQKGASLLEEFRRGIKSTSEVFDVEKMARFHAVIDLVGGYHSLDWSDVKFYYNSDSGKIEPVGYESFSVRETVRIAGQRVPNDYKTAGFNYHDRLFADPVFFEIYIQELERIADANYFDAFTKTIQESLDQKRGVLAREFAYIKFSFEPYYKNIELIQHNLELPKAFHAFLEGKTDSTVQLSIAPVSDYPIEIHSLMVDGKKEFSLDSVITIPAKARNTYAQYVDLSIPYDGKKLKNLTLKGSIPGSQTVFEVAVSDLPSYRMFKDSIIEGDTLESEGSLLVRLNDSTLVFNEKDVNIASVLTIPEGTCLQVNRGQKIRFLRNGQLRVYGSLDLMGGSERSIEITTETADRMPIQLLKASFTAINVTFFNIQSDFIRAEQSDLSFQKCQMADVTGDLISATESTLQFVDCASGSMYSLGGFDRCVLKIKSFTAKNGADFMHSFGSDIEMYASQIEGYSSLADLNYSSNFDTWNSRFSRIDLLSTLNNNSVFNCYSGTITESVQGFRLDFESELLGESRYLLHKTNADLGTKEERKTI